MKRLSLSAALAFSGVALFVHGAESPVPAGAVSLFDGTSKAKWSDAAGWTVDKRALVGAEGGKVLESRQSFANFSLRLEFMPADATSQASIVLPGGARVQIPAGTKKDWQQFELSYQQVEPRKARVSTWVNGQPLQKDVSAKVAGSAGSQQAGGGSAVIFSAEDSKKFKMTGNYSAAIRFSGKNGTLFSKCKESGPWVKNGKALFIQRGKLAMDIGWVGNMQTRSRVDDGKLHTAVLVVKNGHASLFLDGAEQAKRQLDAPDVSDFRVKLGEAGKGFGGKLDGTIQWAAFFNEALSEAEAKTLSRAEKFDDKRAVLSYDTAPASSADEFQPEPFKSVSGIDIPIGLSVSKGSVRFANIQVRPLAPVDHGVLISKLDDAAFKRGKKTYDTLCQSCHGTVDKVGMLPTALRFGKGTFKNGSDMVSMYRTVTEGYGQMVAQTWMKPSEVYDVVHYIRETYVKPHNKSQYVAVDDAYMASLPRGMNIKAPEPKGAQGKLDYRQSNAHLKMNYGPYLMWTYEVAPGNIAYKAIAQRLDGGPGGISKGKMFMAFDHDTMRIAAGWSGKFVNWRGIMFDGSHGTHTGIGGKPTFVNPVGPGWANPATGSFDDPRLRGRDKLPYGPLPREWAQYRGLYKYGDISILLYSVGDAAVLEQMTSAGDGVYARVLNIGKSSKALVHRIAPSTGVQVALAGSGASLAVEDGFHVLKVPGKSIARVKLFISAKGQAVVDAAAKAAGDIPNLRAYTSPGPRIWRETVSTKVVPGKGNAAYVADDIVVPYQNPWSSWMRIGGFDFFKDADRAAMCTVMGDVWTVSGLKSGELKWQRMATGLFQPLGVKIVDDVVYVSCRDQLAVIRDANGDGEADFIQSFNNDHQVTEHFHEFVMGLQTDAEGNFYYAKSARHAKKALVPHHGTLIRVSKDGKTSEILANGFRAANGVCLNPDGSFFVTDQEGHWTPKNRINRVVPNAKAPKFYGNYMGYHNVASSADSEMEEPLVWLTNAYDRSPAELVWVTSKKWGPLAGSLLNISYGYGRIYVIPYEEVNGVSQGGASVLRIPDLPTGVMRGRFHPDDGQLYVAGMSVWATARQDRAGGMWRIRYTGGEVMQPVGMKATVKGLEITFSSELKSAGNFKVQTWHLNRTGNYGGKHSKQKNLAVQSASVNGRVLSLAIDGLAPTRGMSVEGSVQSASGGSYPVKFHNTIHALGSE